MHQKRRAVGILSEGKAYLVVGEHKPINDQLADLCGKNVTVKAAR